MSKTIRKLTTISAGALLAASLSSPNSIAQDYDDESMQHAEPPVADTIVAGEFIEFTAHMEFERAVVRVSGPKGYSATLRVPAGTSAITADLIIDAQPAAMEDPNVHAYASEADGSWHTLPDGEYRYELVMVSGDREIRRQTGEFRVAGGTASDDDHLSQSSTHAPNLLERIAGATLDFLVPSANAGQTFNSYIVLDDHNNGNSSWVSYNSENETTNWRAGHFSGDFIWSKGTFGPTSARMALRDVDDGSLGIGTTNPQNQLHVARSGTNWTAIRIENNANHYLLRTSGVFGFQIRDETGATPFSIGTNAPTDSLHINGDGNVGIGTSSVESFHKLTVDGNAAVNGWIDFTNMSGMNRLAMDSNGFSVRQDNTTQVVVTRDAPLAAMTILSDRAAFSSNLDTGFGTITPDAPLHVRRTDGNAQVLVEETSSGDATLFELSNNGHSRFIFRDTSTSNLWEFRTAGSGNFERFQINRLGSGELEMQVRRGGNMVIAGSLTEGSSREIKDNITEVSADEVLNKLSQLQVHEWSYKSNDEYRHLGPMAEDFHDLFGLGMGPSSIAPRDLAGIALAASQALHLKNQHLDQENQRIRMAKEALAQRLERIEDELNL